MHCCFKPDSSIVGYGNQGIHQFGVIGCPGSSDFCPWNLLSTNVVVGIRCVLCGDAIPSLSIDVEQALEDFEFSPCRDSKSKHSMSPVWCCHHVSSKLILMSPTGCGVVSSVRFLRDLRYLG